MGHPALPVEGERADPAPPSLTALFLRFLRFGLLAWGGPVAQIAMLRRELVEEERWLSGARFNRLLAVYQVLPGPEAHELAVHLGWLRRGRIGGLLAGLGFMLPGFLLMLLLSWLYFRVDLDHPTIAAVLLGAQVGVLALIVRAVERIGRHVVVTRSLFLIALAATLASVGGLAFWVILPIAGAVNVAATRWQHGSLLAAAAGLAALAPLALAATSTGLFPAGDGPLPNAPAQDDAVATVSIAILFLSGLKAGLLTFGGAYTAIPFLREDAVGSGWMSDARFLDGIALSGVIPAPLIIFSTFVGYVAGGPAGAVAMTAGVFLPAFAFTLVFGRHLEALVDRPALRNALEGIAAGVVGLIVATTLELAVALAPRLPSPSAGVALFAVTLAVLVVWRSRLSVVLAIGASGLGGWLLFDVLR